MVTFCHDNEKSHPLPFDGPFACLPSLRRLDGNSPPRLPIHVEHVGASSFDVLDEEEHRALKGLLAKIVSKLIEIF
jgi:hypothetical protein